MDDGRALCALTIGGDEMEADPDTRQATGLQSRRGPALPATRSVRLMFGND